MSYNFSEIEKKWQDFWDKNETFKTDVWDFSKPKFYALDMFPYPSGQGLHVGHPEGYTATDILRKIVYIILKIILHYFHYSKCKFEESKYIYKLTK